MLRGKTCQNRRLAYFYELPKTSGIFRSKMGIGKHTVTIVIRDGPGFPRFCAGFHMSSERDLSIWGQPSIRISGEGSVTVFNVNIVQGDPAVQGIGGAGIFLVYREGITKA